MALPAGRRVTSGRRLLAAVAVAAAAGLAVPAAADSPTRDSRGSCSLTPTGEQSAAQQSVLLSAAVVVFSTADPADPVSATVRCTYLLDGYPWAAATFSGTVLVAGARPAWALIPGSDQVVELCTRVEYDNGEADESCTTETRIEVPPEEVWTEVDAAVCPLIAATAPGVLGVVDVNAEGDVWVAGEPLWDCPPYDAWQEPPPAPTGSRSRTGGCGLTSWDNHTSSDTFAMTVRCTLTVNGAPAREAVFTGTGVVAGAEHLTFTAVDGDAFALCTRIDYDTSAYEEWCRPLATTQLPPDALDPVWSTVDPAVCSVLAAVGPGAPGVLDVTPQGDVAVAGEPVWDCPPYGVADPSATPADRVLRQSW